MSNVSARVAETLIEADPKAETALHRAASWLKTVEVEIVHEGKTILLSLEAHGESGLDALMAAFGHVKAAKVTTLSTPETTAPVPETTATDPETKAANSETTAAEPETHEEASLHRYDRPGDGHFGIAAEPVVVKSDLGTQPLP